MLLLTRFVLSSDHPTGEFVLSLAENGRRLVPLLTRAGLTS